eukprot:TRINITY_DN8856_c0_g1_i1.p1 TRINITY_DN8856_c0_g1~~TRINITY_DN8856_c0_g1_i1.p1  ORF type:complete len:858 (+),score=96.68 TRINITY_DN8856_c0_g1_i1:59-2632(+)
MKSFIKLNRFCNSAMKFCDLRYLEIEEHAFKADMHRNLAISCIVMVCAFLPGLWFVSLPEFLAEVGRSEAPFIWSVDDPRTLMYSVHIFINLAAFFIITTAGLTLTRGWFYEHFEFLMTSTFAAIAASIPFANYWYAAFACGAHPDSVWIRDARDGEMTVLICTIAVATACCNFLPIRVCCMWLIPASGFSSFALSSIVLGSPYPRNQYVNICFLGILDAFACLGTFRSETLARNRWSASLRIIEQQKELHESETLARAMHQMAESLVDAVVCLGPRYKITAWESKLTSSFGDMEGQKYIELLRDDCRSQFQKGLSRAAKKGTLQCIPATLLRTEGEQEADLLVVFADSQRHTYVVGMVLKGNWQAADGDVDGITVSPEAAAVLDVELESVSSFDSAVSSAFSTETTLTGDLFRSFDDQDLHRTLSLIEKLGLREHWNIDLSAVKISAERLGIGGFGKVFKGYLHGTSVAVKFCHANRHALLSLLHELRIMRFVRHPNIVAFHGACIDVDHLQVGLIFDFVGGGTLGHYIETVDSHPRDTGTNMRCCCKILLDICSALRYLHYCTDVPLAHGDLSPRNILVRDEASPPQAILIDFGLAQKLDSHRNSSAGRTIRYAAPEMLQQSGARHNVSTDVYSFGGIMYYVLTLQKPHAEMDEQQIKSKLLFEGALPELPWPPETYFLCEGKELCEDCMQPDPSKRPKMQDVHMRLSYWLPPHTFCSQSLEDDEFPSWEEVFGPTSNENPAALPQPSSRLVCAAYPETTDAAKQRSLLRAALTWNLGMSSSDCCHAHVVQRELFRIARHVKPGAGCTWDLMPHQADYTFCKHCEVLELSSARMAGDGNCCMHCQQPFHGKTIDL